MPENNVKYGGVQKYFISFDGTEIGYQEYGDNHNPAMILTNGLGGNYTAFQHIIKYYKDKFHIICWDYRGLFSSGPPPEKDSLSVDDHCKDLAALLEKENISRAIFTGWSMGVQVNLEFYRFHPEKFQAMILLNGTYGKAFETVFGFKPMKYIIPPFLKGLQQANTLFKWAASKAIDAEWIIDIAAFIKMVKKDISRDVFRDLMHAWQSVDFYYYYGILNELGKHDASDIMTDISCPMLIITGDRDIFTPYETAIKLSEMIPDAELKIFQGGSHYAAAEFPDEINQRIEQFLKDKLIL